MSRSFQLVAPEQFQSQLNQLPIAYCTPVKNVPGAFLTLIDWTITYGAGQSRPRLGVAIDLGNVPGSPLQIDAIRGIKIDNTFSSCTVYVQFSDTGDTIVCPPYSIVQDVVLTNGTKLIVYAEGFLDLTFPQTSILFANTPLPPLYVSAGRPQPPTSTLYTSNAVTSDATKFSSSFTVPNGVNRYAVVCVYMRTGIAPYTGTFTGTVNGAAPLIVQSSIQTTLPLNRGLITGMMGRAIPNGVTSIPITVTPAPFVPADMDEVLFRMFMLENLQVPTAPLSSGSFSTATVPFLGLSLNIPTDGIAVYMGAKDNSLTTVTINSPLDMSIDDLSGDSTSAVTFLTGAWHGVPPLGGKIYAQFETLNALTGMSFQ